MVVVMNDIVASGAFMMSMGANHTFAKPSSFVGSVGVVLTSPGPLIPPAPDEREISTGPFKRGSDRRYFIALLDQLKESFAQIVVTERGDKLRISREELTQGRIYSGIEGVRLGLVDEIGGDTDAIEKAASLAGISDYDLLDVNTEVLRIFFQKLARIVEPLDDAGGQSTLADIGIITTLLRGTGDGGNAPDGVPSVASLRRLLLPSGISEVQREWPPGLPLEIRKPRIYYLYVGPSE